MPVDASILVVDDDIGVRSALCLALEFHGWKVRGFASAQAFLDGYVPSGNDFLILDLHLTGMNGVALLEELNIRGLRPPAVLMTARPDDPLALRALSAGAVTVLTKPFKATELLPILERVLGNHAVGT